MGIYVSLATSIVSFSILFGMSYTPMSLEGSVILGNVVSNFIAYSGDVLIAKQCYDLIVDGQMTKVRFDQWDLEQRFFWYLRSLVSKTFSNSC